MPTYPFSKGEIQAIAPSTFERGWSYWQDGAVLRVTVRGDQLFAAVQGSDDEPYQVQIRFSADGVETWTCSCPYEWDGACKHVVAVLLVAIHDGHEIEERQPLDTLLAELDAAQLRRVVLALVAQAPALADVVEQTTHQLQRRPHKRRTP